jgi:cell division protein FtsB
VTGTSFPRRQEDVPRRKLPIGRWILGAFLAFTVYAWTFGPYGIARQHRTAQDLAALRSRNDSLRQALHALQDSLRLLRTDSATIASEARTQGLVLPGEVSVRFVDTAAGR